MRPKLIQCDKCSTFYDPNQHSHCPYCPVPGLKAGSTIGETIGRTPAPPPPPPPPPLPRRPVERRVEPATGGQVTRGRSIDGKGHSGQMPSPPVEGVTVGVYAKEMKIDPVVGWLICIEGKERGRDYRIYSDRNFIGRGESMKICIKGDDTISRERHAEINFDARHNAFYIAPGEGRGNTYLNDSPVLGAEEIKAWDIVEIGTTKLAFLPLCGPRFNWTDSVVPPKTRARTKTTSAEK